MIWLSVQGPIKTVMGTIDFMAPEILRVPRRHHYTHDTHYRAALDACPGFGLPVDVWAFGVTVYEALSGRRPWLSRDKVRALWSGDATAPAVFHCHSSVLHRDVLADSRWMHVAWFIVCVRCVHHLALCRCNSAVAVCQPHASACQRHVTS